MPEPINPRWSRANRADDERKERVLIYNLPIAKQIAHHKRMLGACMRAADSPDWKLSRADPKADRARYVADAEVHQARLDELWAEQQAKTSTVKRKAA